MEKHCWFQDWFNSPYYHLLYNKRDDEEAHFFINNLCSYLSLSPQSFVWDLACGRGRHSLALAEKGFNVTGTDLSEQNIKDARTHKKDNVDFYEHDMRKPFRINYFNCVMNLFTSIGYFESVKDNFVVFKNVYSALKPGGYFVVDFFNSDKVSKELVPHYIEQRKDITFDITKQVKDKTIHKTIRFTHNGKDYIFEETVSLLHKNDFEEFAKQSGFTIERIFGDYELGPFDPATSNRLILIFKK